MSWSASGLGRQWVIDTFAGTITPKWRSSSTPDVFNVAIYDNTVSPSRDDTAAAFAYGGATWGSGGGGTGSPQVFQSGQWAQGGQTLASGNTTSATGGAGIAMFDAADLASGTACTISNAYGCLVYDNTLAGKNGICYNYFGTGAAVTNGTFTVQWSANGVWRIT